MPVFHDYQCTSCDHLVEDVMVERKADIKRQVKCPECQGVAKMYFGGFNSMSRWNFSSSERGYNKGFADPQTGVEYTSYAHRQQVLREMGMEETGASQKHDHIMADAESAQRAQVAAEGDRVGVIAADSVDEIVGQIDEDRIDRGATGDMNRDTGPDWSPFSDD
jgi:DNA-directed RNA polymerase subunit RPC12/RpoP|tara:strand:+ start:373 stop:864 length:492 start_codon:yes stop_codon:yes gene_type:complete